MLNVDWATIRQAFKDARKQRGLDQAEIKGLPQAMVSKLENNANQGPSVETFVTAVRGLGMPVSTFFAQIEGTSARPQVVDHESLPPLASDQGIAAAAVRRLTERIATLEKRLDRLKQNPRVSKADDRHAAATRAEAAERGAAGRIRRPRNAALQRRRPPAK